MNAQEHKILCLLHSLSYCRAAKPLINNDIAIVPASGKIDYVKFPCDTDGNQAGKPRSLALDALTPVTLPVTAPVAVLLLPAPQDRHALPVLPRFSKGGARAAAQVPETPVRPVSGTGPIFICLFDRDQLSGAGEGIRPADKAGDLNAPARRTQKKNDVRRKRGANEERSGRTTTGSARHGLMPRVSFPVRVAIPGSRAKDLKGSIATPKKSFHAEESCLGHVISGGLCRVQRPAAPRVSPRPAFADAARPLSFGLMVRPGHDTRAHDSRKVQGGSVSSPPRAASVNSGGGVPPLGLVPTAAPFSPATTRAGEPAAPGIRTVLGASKDKSPGPLQITPPGLSAGTVAGCPSVVRRAA